MIAHHHQYAAEAFGTFVLTMAVCATLVADLPMSTPVAAALTLGVMVYTIGKVSGSHLNPAVTIALATRGKISWKDSIFYIIAQMLGAVGAMFAGAWLLGGSPELTVSDDMTVLGAEVLGAAILTFGIASAVRNNDYPTSGALVGASLFAGITLAAGASNAVLNPAVAVGIGSVSAAYMIAPIIGALIGAWVNAWLHAEV